MIDFILTIIDIVVDLIADLICNPLIDKIAAKFHGRKKQKDCK